jgi:DNA invertase Pin-like site-specific DNA recombinase
MQEEMKAAIYSRVACADEVRVINQEEMLLQFAKRSGFGECVCYRDNGESGLSVNADAFCPSTDGGKCA